MTRALFVALLAACGIGLAACARRAEPLLPPQHVLLVTIEDLRADRLSCYQHLAPTSRFDHTLEERIEGRAFGLDELARGGVLFAQAFASSGERLPSLAALHTGRSPVETGVLDEHGALDPDEETLASTLERAGFDTAAFVSAPRAGLRSALGRGFRRFAPCADDAAAIEAAAAHFERDTGDGRSTFVWLHLSALALPWDDALAPSDGRKFGAPALAEPAVGSSAWLARGETELDPRARAALAARYDERLRATLERLAGFLSRTYDWSTSPVEASETWARTLFVLAGTNGFELGERGAVGSGASPHEEALRVPLLLRHPDSLTGERVVLELVTLEDVLPTVVDAFSLDVPKEVDGRSLLDLLDDRTAPAFPSRPAVAVLPGPIYSLRTPELRAVWNRWEEPVREGVRHAPAALALYDRAADPLELVDRTGDAPVPNQASSDRSAAAIAREALLAWRAARTVWTPSRARESARPPLKR
ncbi:MAG: sulfatase-like hydrolase/transferase [Planctomycetes bacterium]|nr:sulfatase-like hydrolase/transferase [Planctomycetota bacterium]